MRWPLGPAGRCPARDRLYSATSPRPPADPTNQRSMSTTTEQSLIAKIRTLSPREMAEVEDFVEFLATKAQRRSALDRLLAIAPALEAAGAALPPEDEIATEIPAARADRRAKTAKVPAN